MTIILWNMLVEIVYVLVCLNYDLDFNQLSNLDTKSESL